MKYYICTYTDYTGLPEQLFEGNSPIGAERKSLDGLKFVARSETDQAGEGGLNWMNGDEVELSHDEIVQEMANSEWSLDE